jgi:GntR family transcriptional regulator, rspAB operon transcriptional repressor
MEITRLRRERAVDAVYQALKQAIVNSMLRPGERLDIDELAGKLGVSLTPVRGAVQRLATEGLIEIRPRSGTFVASLSARDIDETLRIRCALECLAAEDVIANLTPEDVRRLKQLLRELRRPVRSEADRAAHESANRELHRAMIRGSGNRRLCEMYDLLDTHLKIARIHASETGWPARLRDERAEHEAIVEAIVQRDTAGLQSALRSHIYRARDAMMAALREPAPAAGA